MRPKKVTVIMEIDGDTHSFQNVIRFALNQFTDKNWEIDVYTAPADNEVLQTSFKPKTVKNVAILNVPDVPAATEADFPGASGDPPTTP